jgi:hypothetical protein
MFLLNTFAALRDQIDIKYTQMPSPSYQNTFNLIVGFPIWRCPIIFMVVAMWEHCIYTVRFLYVAKFTTPSLLLLLISIKLPFPIFCLKMSSLPTSLLKSLTTFPYVI